MALLAVKWTINKRRSQYIVFSVLSSRPLQEVNKLTKWHKLISDIFAPSKVKSVYGSPSEKRIHLLLSQLYFSPCG